MGRICDGGCLTARTVLRSPSQFDNAGAASIVFCCSQDPWTGNEAAAAGPAAQHRTERCQGSCFDQVQRADAATAAFSVHIAAATAPGTATSAAATCDAAFSIKLAAATAHGTAAAAAPAAAICDPAAAAAAVFQLHVQWCSLTGVAKTDGRAGYE